MSISYAVFCLKKKKKNIYIYTLSLFVILSFFFNATATTEIYTLSLHDALPISLVAYLYDGLPVNRRGHRLPPVRGDRRQGHREQGSGHEGAFQVDAGGISGVRSEEHTSELQSHVNLVCRLLLEKKKKKYIYLYIITLCHIIFFF